MLRRFQQQKIQNGFRTFLLFAGMLALVLLLGFLLLGKEGLIWAGILGAGMLYFSTRISTKYIMRMYRGRELSSREAPQITRIIQILSDRAGLKEIPKLYYIPQQVINAFATGSQREPAVALTHGIISQLTLRELTGVLAHEISHIKNQDFKLKGAANIMGRLTRIFSFVGQIFLFINLPLYLMGEETIPWVAVILLIFAPILSGLMMTALSRTRERDADLEAARLTGDPNGLADALQKLSYLNNGGVLERMIPKSLNTHPQTGERVRRLRELGPDYTPVFEFPDTPVSNPYRPVLQQRSWWI